MNNQDSDGILLKVIEKDKNRITLEEDSFSTICTTLYSMQKSSNKQRMVINYCILPIILLTLMTNIVLLFDGNQSEQTANTIHVFAEENYIKTSANYFSEVLLDK